jgi:hypothetical protein
MWKKTNSNKFWAKLHTFLSMFFLPMAVIYFLTGSLYLLGLRGDLTRENIKVMLDEPLSENIDSQQKFVAEQLEARSIQVPRGPVRFSRGRFLWGRLSGYHVTLQIRSDPNEAQIQTNRPNLFGRFMSLHLGRGGSFFNYLGIAFAISMVVIYFTGIVLCLKILYLRRTILLSLIVGILVALAAVFLSM